MLKGFSTRYYSPDDTGGTSAEPQQAQPEQQPTAGASDDKRFTQAELEAIVKDRLERQKRASEAAKEKAEKEAAEKALKEQGEFKTLAEQRAAEVEALKPKAEYAEQLEAVVRKLLDEQRKDVPKHIIALLDKLSITDQLDYIASNRAEWSKSQQPAAPDINAGARNTGKPGEVTAEQRENDMRRKAKMW